jgi:D-aminopeptidase
MLIEPAMGLLMAAMTFAGVGERAEGRPRARDLGIEPGACPPGPLNAITDVEGVRVGHFTLIDGDQVHTGVTAVLPHGGNLFQEKVPGAVFVGNAFGKLAGSTQVEELGTIETPVVLTNTLAVGTAVEAVVAYTLAQQGNENVVSVNAVVGETNDSGLSDIRRMPLRREHILSAITAARGGAVPEGSVGAGTGTQCFGWKGGIGTASRVLPKRFGGYTLGVLVQANFGGLLMVTGAPVGKALGHNPFAADARRSEKTERGTAGSCMIVVATDAPIDARDLRRLAARAIFGMGRTGASYSHSSGDFAIAFSTAPELRVRHGSREPQTRTILPSEAVSPLFQAALECTEEAILNALLQATPVTYCGHTVEPIPIEPLRTILKRHGIGK